MPSIPGEQPAKPFIEQLDTPLSRAYEDLIVVIESNDPRAQRINSLPLQQRGQAWYVTLQKTGLETGNGIRIVLTDNAEIAADDEQWGTEEMYVVFPDRVTRDDEQLDAGQVDELLEALSPILLLSTAEKRPLATVDGRPEAMKRCIGPLVSALTFENADLFRQDAASWSVLRNLLEQDPLASPWFAEIRNFATILDAVTGLGRTLGAGTKASITHSAFLRPTQAQQNLFAHNTYHETVEASFQVAHDSQAEILARILLPAYLATRDDLRTREDLLATLNRVSLQDILQIMRSFDTKELVRTTFAPSATFDSVGFMQDASDPDEEFYGPNSILVRPIPEHLASLPVTPPHERQPHYFSAFNLYVRTQQGGIIINPAYFESAEVGVHLDTDKTKQPDSLAPTTGCPAGRHSFRLQTGDLSRTQLATLKASPHFAVRVGQTGVTLEMQTSAVEHLHQKQIEQLTGLLQV